MTSSTSPLPSFAADGPAGAVTQRLGWFCAHPAAHARFLNTLSLMEHIGSRKIMASQSEHGLSGDTLRHLAEETRHAYFFKRSAEKLARRALGYSTSETIAGAAARGYMERLDAEILRELAGAESALPYLYMSLIVELRAVWFYRLYQEALAEHEQSLSLRSVLAEEELHLGVMLARLSGMDKDFAARVKHFQALERERFRVLWDAIESECNSERLAAE
jgi:hypothetical protein